MSQTFSGYENHGPGGHPLEVFNCFPYYSGMEKIAAYWIKKLALEPHPEGGYYRETYRSTESIPRAGLPNRFSAERNFSTAIYFLLESHHRSHFHRIKSDELWHYHAGGPLAIYIIESSQLTVKVLGPDPDKNESLQHFVPANCWFGAMCLDNNSYTLAGCTVAPGFDFADFELADRSDLLRTFPAHSDIITALTT